jgi:hypothetical protein
LCYAPKLYSQHEFDACGLAARVNADTGSGLFRVNRPEKGASQGLKRGGAIEDPFAIQSCQTYPE